MADFIGTVILLLFVWLIGFVHGIGFLEDKAALTSCAQFNPETSKFEWLEKIKND